MDWMPWLPAAISATLIVLLVPGYLLWLKSRSRPPQPEAAGAGSARGSLDVIVPVRDEASLIAEKLDDLAKLRVPEGTNFWIVDGASSDGTPRIVAARIEKDPRFTLLHAPVGDKTSQLNLALLRSRAEWVLVTDADARVPHDTAEAMLGAAAADPSIAALGAPVEPRRAHPLELLWWRSTNRVRLAESRRGSAAIVTGPCYMFRRNLLPSGFPGAVVADDVHAALAAVAAGGRVAFVDRLVIETRSPLGLLELFRHKSRKADAYLREVVRFLPRSATFASPAREVFLWRAAQLVLFPLFATSGAAALAVGLTLAGTGALVTAAGVLAAVSGIDGAVALVRRRPPMLIQSTALLVLLAGVLLTALVGFPFSRQTACLPKVGAAAAERQAAA